MFMHINVYERIECLKLFLKMFEFKYVLHSYMYIKFYLIVFII